MDKTIVKNLIYSAAYRVLTIILPLVTTPYISRVLKPEGVGIFSYTSSIAAIFTLVAALGFNTYGQREVAYRQDNLHGRSVVFFEILIVRAFTTVFVVIAYLGFCVFYREYTLFLLPQCLSIISVAFDVSWYFHGLENFRITVIRSIVIRLISIFCIFVFIRRQEDLLLYIVIISVSNLFSNLVYLVYLKKYIVKVQVSELYPMRHIRSSIEFFIPLIAVEIYSHLDRVMLGYMMPTTVESGYYEQARKITSLLVSLIISVNAVMMPRIANLYAKNETTRIKDYYSKSFRTVLLIMIPACVGLVLVSDDFVLWFFGDEYSKVSELIKLSSLLIVFMCIGNFVGVQYLSTTGQQNKMTKAYVTAAILNVAINAVLIPRLAAVGAMLASIFAEFISCSLQVFWLIRSEYRFNMTEKLWKYVLASVGMAGAIIMLHKIVNLQGMVSTLSDVVLGGITYAVLLLAVKEENIKQIFKL